MKNLFYACILALLPLGGFAQTARCGPPPAELAVLQQRLQKNLAAAPAAGLRTVQYVPLRFHRVANSDGEKRIAYRHLLDVLTAVNADFAAGDIQFYLHDDGSGLFGNGIASDLIFSDALYAGANLVMESQRDTAAINLYVVDEINGPNQAGVVLGYFSPDNNWIILGKTAVATSEKWTTSHEIGHYFNLLHPFHGWEIPFDAAFTSYYPTWPVAPDSINGYPVELMDGSNCLESGDQICDTPPDYLFASSANAPCAPYDGGALDPNGQPVAPMINNIMGAFSGCDDYVFTPGQFSAMSAELASPEQANLVNNFVPAATEIVVPPNLLVSPPFNFQFPTNVDIQLDWLDVAGATHYLVEVDILPSFTSPVRLELVTTASEITLTQPLTPNQKHYWRVRPFNAYAAAPTPQLAPEDWPDMEGPSETGGAAFDLVLGAFFTGAASTGAHAPSGDARIHVAPNPATAGDFVRLTVETPLPAAATLRVFDAAGRLILTENRPLPAGSTSWPVAAEKLTPGVNLFQINLDGQLLTLKVTRR